jgi:hypothetical protein
MNNTEKKLDALIDALGFDVEQIRTRDNETYNHDLKAYGGMLGMMPANGRDYIRTEFKLTKRDKPVDNTPVGLGPMPENSAAWGSIVRYILRHRMEIELGSDDFDTLRPALSFFNGTSK